MIAWLRRHIAPFAAVLLVLVTAQLLDLPLCADELEETRHSHADVADILAYGASLASLHPVPDAGPSHDDGAAFPDCLCHFIFVSTAHPPVVERPPISHHVFVTEIMNALSAPAFPISHIPLV